MKQVPETHAERTLRATDGVNVDATATPCSASHAVVSGAAPTPRFSARPAAPPGPLRDAVPVEEVLADGAVGADG